MPVSCTYPGQKGLFGRISGGMYTESATERGFGVHTRYVQRTLQRQNPILTRFYPISWRRPSPSTILTRFCPISWRRSSPDHPRAPPGAPRLKPEEREEGRGPAGGVTAGEAQLPRGQKAPQAPVPFSPTVHHSRKQMNIAKTEDGTYRVCAAQALWNASFLYIPRPKGPFRLYFGRYVHGKCHRIRFWCTYRVCAARNAGVFCGHVPVHRHRRQFWCTYRVCAA